VSVFVESIDTENILNMKVIKTKEVRPPSKEATLSAAPVFKVTVTYFLVPAKLSVALLLSLFSFV